MGALGGPPEEIGHKVAAALVGTFLGILLCYGVIGPIASYMSRLKEEEESFFRFLRVAVHSFTRGDSPIISVEYARRSIQTSVRPNFQDTEAHCRGISAEAKPDQTQAA
jgi:chemotaxis protein MotA